jgi:quercetin 2,3-dioxygenase
MYKTVKHSAQKKLKQNALGFSSVDNFNHELPIEPFLVFTEFHMSRPIFGPHPHAGVSVMTYMLPTSEGSFLNRDSHGDHSIIEPGGMHVTQAGSGIKHDEVPTIVGVDCHGFQIWINHADRDRLVAPRAYHAFAKDIKEYADDQMNVRVLQGEYKGLTAPFELVTKVVLLDVKLQPGATIDLSAMPMAFLYGLGGEGLLSGAKIEQNALVLLSDDGDRVQVTASERGLHFLFASGTPHQEPIVYGGPYVMTTDEQLSETKIRYAKGEMGILDPLPA